MPSDAPLVRRWTRPGPVHRLPSICNGDAGRGSYVPAAYGLTRESADATAAAASSADVTGLDVAADLPLVLSSRLDSV
jgi:hypothetical protein